MVLTVYTYCGRRICEDSRNAVILIRRSFWFSLAALASLPITSLTAVAQQSTVKNEYTIYVATYTNDGNSRGIYAFRFQPAEGIVNLSYSE